MANISTVEREGLVDVFYRGKLERSVERSKVEDARNSIVTREIAEGIRAKARSDDAERRKTHEVSERDRLKRFFNQTPSADSFFTT